MKPRTCLDLDPDLALALTEEIKIKIRSKSKIAESAFQGTELWAYPAK
jgi:hypothetical protein